MEDNTNFKVTGLAATSDIDANQLAEAFRQIAKATRTFTRRLVRIWKLPGFQKLLRDIKRWDREMKRRGVFPREARPRPLSHCRASAYVRKRYMYPDDWMKVARFEADRQIMRGIIDKWKSQTCRHCAK